MLTVKQLREYLDSVEAKWSEMDKEYLGSFDNQEVCIAASGVGITQDVGIYYHGGFGMVIHDLNP